MTSNRRKQFERDYQDALNYHLQRKARGRLTSRAARKMGREAASLGLNAMDLALIHDQSVRKSISSDLLELEKDLLISPATIFYIETLTPLEQVRNAERTSWLRDSKRLERQLGQEVNRHAKLLAKSQRHQEQARQLTHHFSLAQERERKEISRELHDEIAQVLAGINVRLAALKKLALLGRSDIGHQIDQTQKLVEQSVSAVHRYALRLRPSLLDDLGLVPSLRSYIKNFPGRNGLSIRLKANCEAEFLSNEERTALYRVAQEALTNVARHAEANVVNVSLRKLSDRIRLVVRDDGKSFDAKRILNSISPKRLGLLGMRERVEMLGGSFSIVSTPKKGTSIRAEIPMKPVVSKKVS